MPPLRRAEEDAAASDGIASGRSVARRARPPAAARPASSVTTLEVNGVRVLLEPHRVTIDFATAP